MKQKIKIMKQHQHPSDEEIQSYMNFDHLLDSRKVALSSSRIMSVLRWSIPTLTITSLILWFFLVQDKPPEKLVDESKKQSGISNDIKQTPPAVASDSSFVGRRERSTSAKDEHTPDGDAKISKPSLAAPVIKEKSEPIQKESEYAPAEPAKGYDDLYDFFSANLEYPADGLKDSVQGVQTISFVINTAGKPEQIQVVNSLGEPFDREARRLIEKMPAWKPATLNGQPVESKISIPITFQIQKVKN
jgi:TonB family protein